MNVIDSEWVLTIKYDIDGQPKMKTQLCIRRLKNKNIYLYCDAYTSIALLTAIAI